MQNIEMGYLPFARRNELGERVSLTGIFVCVQLVDSMYAKCKSRSDGTSISLVTPTDSFPHLWNLQIQIEILNQILSKCQSKWSMIHSPYMANLAN